MKKKLFISCPMKGRAEATFGEELEKRTCAHGNVLGGDY